MVSKPRKSIGLLILAVVAGSFVLDVPVEAGSSTTSASLATSTIAGHIYECAVGSPTTIEIPGGFLSASGPQTVNVQANPLAPTDVVDGTYTMFANAPPGFQFVACGGSASIGTPPTNADLAVTVPSGGAGVGIFYVADIAAMAQTIAGHILDCSTGTPTLTEVPGGFLSASGPQTVNAQTNPLTPTNVVDGTYTMFANAPPGFQFVACGGSASIGTPPTNADLTVTVPKGGAGVGNFFVARTPPPCPAGQKLNFRWHYSANGTSGSWSGTKSVLCPGSIIQGPQSMEGDLKIAPGTTLLAGFDLTAPGNSSTFTVTINSAKVVFNVRCVSGAAPTQATLTVSIPSISYKVTGSGWFPSGDQHSPLVYQGSIVAPDACRGGNLRLNQGGTFSANIV